MKLKDYLEKNNISQSDFARLIGAPPSAITKWIHKETIPDRDNMPKIYSATNGAVSPNDFYDLPTLNEHQPTIHLHPQPAPAITITITITPAEPPRVRVVKAE